MDGRYEAHVDPSVLARVRAECLRQQSKQKTHTKYLDRLHQFAKGLTLKEHREVVSSEVISSLATSLLDGTVFQIVRELEEIQQIRERDLFNRRMKAVNKQRARKSAFTRKCAGNPKADPAYLREEEQMEAEMEAEMRQLDQAVILELDQHVAEQQATLQKAGVPCMAVTNKGDDVSLQMQILLWIQRLSRLQA
eukprot:m.161113 g.161113  ORF g.161113 m.161113 type:complete len:194 (+) comp38800_c1_seq1:142-723(+)